MMTKQAVMALGSAVILTFPVAAQAEAPARDPLAVQAGAVSDKVMKEFIDVHEDVEKLSLKYQEKIGEADSQAEKNKLANEANAEMKKTVEKSDLGLDRYNQLAARVQTDSNVKAQYERLKK